MFAANASRPQENNYFPAGALVQNVSLEEGVAKMAAWAKKAGARQGKASAGIEVRKNLPSSWASLERSA
jgi:hypothetical protein